MNAHAAPQGAFPDRDGTLFRVWAPASAAVSLVLCGAKKKMIAMRQSGGGYWEALSQSAGPGTLYKYLLEGRGEFPDPASAAQPQGVHGPSMVPQPPEAFSWTDQAWKGASPSEMIIYELHPGTFSPGGDLRGVMEKLPYLKDLGINAVELMPLAQFPGTRNWGYDGVYPYAVQDSYGGPEALKALVNACHTEGIAVMLDVVYNHLGPEGNYLSNFGPYFTDRYRTPWGSAINYDGADSAPVREFFIGNAMRWFREFRVDALRLDAVHGIFDFGAKHFLAELAERTAELSRETGVRRAIIAESDLNDTRLALPAREGGLGMDAQWSDDFHHALHTVLTGERSGYYEDFGTFQQLGKAFSEGFVYTWEWSRHRRRMHGSPSWRLDTSAFVVCAQNHDQVGNRMMGDRLSSLVSRRRLKMAAAAVLLSPYIPLLFMGEEYGETGPFLYFTSHGDKGLAEAVREGRKREFSAFGWKEEPPDPQDENTFSRCRLDWGRTASPEGRELLALYKALIALRKHEPSLRPGPREGMVVRCAEDKATISLFRKGSSSATFTIFNFSDKPVSRGLPPGNWTTLFDPDAPYAAPAPAAEIELPPESFRVYRRTER